MNTADKGAFLQTQLEQLQKILLHPFHTIHKLKVTTKKPSKEKNSVKLAVLYHITMD